jgi:5-methylcytosine-specific restriction endonuclease McrA
MSLSQEASERAARTRLNKYLQKKSKKERKRQNYLAYIDSPEWDQKRRHMLYLANNTCQQCGATDTVLHVHHLTYMRFGHENDSDLMVLCESCHKQKHRRF